MQSQKYYIYPTQVDTWKSIYNRWKIRIMSPLLWTRFLRTVKPPCYWKTVLLK